MERVLIRHVRYWAAKLPILSLVGYMSLGSTYGYYALFLFFLALSVFGLTKAKRRIFTEYFQGFLGVLIASAVFIGLVNAILSRNDAKNLLVYSLIGIGHFAGLAFGRRIASVSRSDAEGIFRSIAIAELLLLIPRLLVVGVAVRTSLGFTYLLPFVFTLSRLNLRAYFEFFAVNATYLAAIFLSGLRSVLLPGLLIYATSLIAFLAARGKNWQRMMFLIPMAACFFAAYGFNLLNLRSYLDSAVNVVYVRMQQTILSDEELRLDPQAGRKDEAEFAIRTFEKEANFFDVIFGRGYGFSYIDESKDGEVTAHVHVTPVAYYLRHGIAGALLYLFMLLDVLRIFFFAKQISFPQRFSLVAWMFSSLIAGSIIMPVFWIYYGYCREIAGLKAR